MLTVYSPLGQVLGDPRLWKTEAQSPPGLHAPSNFLASPHHSRYMPGTLLAQDLHLAVPLAWNLLLSDNTQASFPGFLHVHVPMSPPQESLLWSHCLNQPNTLCAFACFLVFTEQDLSLSLLCKITSKLITTKSVSPGPTFLRLSKSPRPPAHWTHWSSSTPLCQCKGHLREDVPGPSQVDLPPHPQCLHCFFYTTYHHPLILLPNLFTCWLLLTILTAPWGQGLFLLRL